MINRDNKGRFVIGGNPWNKKYNDSQVIDLYLNGNTIKSITKMVGCSDCHIYHIFKRNNINLKELSTNKQNKIKKLTHKFNKEDITNIISLYPQYSTVSIGRKFNCSPQAIMYLLKKNNMPIKGSTYFNKGKHCGNEFRKGRIPWNKGLKDWMSKESKESMMEKKKGKIPYNKGMKASEEDIVKFRERALNLWKSQEHREKHRINTTLALNKPEIKLKIKQSQKQKWGNPEYRLKMKPYLDILHQNNKEKMKNVDYKEGWLKKARAGFRKPNKPEKIIIDLIEKNNIPFNYVGDGEIWFRGENYMFNPDFLSKNPKHIIEIYGDYWHNLPKYKKRDGERLETYAKYGYKTLIIWEHELKNSSQVLEKIKEFIK